MYETQSSFPTALSELGSLDEKGKPVKSRIKDVKSAVGIYKALHKADEQSSANRARIDAMFDGANPYSAAKLAASGQGLKTNLRPSEINPDIYYKITELFEQM